MDFKKIVKLQVEHRYDPLTGQETRINPARANRPKQGEGDNSFDEVIKKSQERCPFCPDKILEKVPKFPEHIAKDGRVRKNQTIIFPNMSPFGSNHAVGVISDAHYLPMDKYEPNLLHDALVAAQAYVKSIYHHEKSAKYPTLVWNFLPPSAGSIIHPHIQMLVEDEPVPALKDRMKKLEAYYHAHKRNYFADLIDFEKKQGERYLGGNESVEVITTFAPRGYNEIEFIVPHVSSLGDMNEKQLQDLAVVLYKALLGYKSYGVGSFNLASYSGAFGEERQDFWLHFKLFSRPFPNGVYTNDTGPMERMYDSWVIDSIPEKLNEAVKPFFSK